MYPIYLVDLFFLTLNKIVCFVIKSCILCLKMFEEFCVCKNICIELHEQETRNCRDYICS